MFFATKNTVTQTVEACIPWEFKATETITLQIRKVKEDRQEWYRTAATQHCFYTGIEGVNNTHRVSNKENPPEFIHAFVADYDVAISDARIAEIINDMPIKPTWVETSLGGNRRFIFLLEEKIRVSGSVEFTIALLTEAKKWLSLDLAPCLDEQAFLDPCRLYCNGCVWVNHTHPPIPIKKAQALVVKVAKAQSFLKQVKSEEIIPLDIILPELKRRFPNFSWPSDFIVGSQGPSFWIPESKSPMSAMVKEGGMLSFSAHAVKLFHKWSELLGADFTKDYIEDVVTKATKDIFFDGKVYYMKDLEGFFRWREKSEMEEFWRTDFRVSAKSTDGPSQLSMVRLYVYKHARVDAAVPVVMRRPGPLTVNGSRVLNIYRYKPILPAEGPQLWGPSGMFPISSAMFDNIFNPKTQLDYFLAWWKRLYEMALAWDPYPIQYSYFLGGPGIGKTLMNRFYVGMSLGSFVDACDYLMHGNTFNSQLYHSPYWALDDEAPVHGRTAKFHAALKKMVANDSHMSNEKFKVAGMTEWRGGIGITGNLDEISLSIVGSLEGSVLDKTNLFRCVEAFDPNVFVFPARKEMEEIRKRELPYLLKWVLDWKVPEHALKDSRYGNKAYQEPELLSRVQQTSRVNPFKETLVGLLHMFFNTHPEAEEWRGGIRELTQLIQSDPVHSLMDRRLDSSSINLSMERVSREGILKVTTVEGEMKTRIWVIKRDPHFARKPEAATPEQAVGSNFEVKR